MSNEQKTNSAEASIDLRKAMSKLEQSMTSGTNKESVALALTVQRLSVTLLESIVDERCIQIGEKHVMKAARATQSPGEQA
jgi:hypothetical protein